ncbi:hypothetical protein EJB05_02643, partial [Eragrostis curvula]
MLAQLPFSSHRSPAPTNQVGAANKVSAAVQRRQPRKAAATAQPYPIAAITDVPRRSRHRRSLVASRRRPPRLSSLANPAAIAYVRSLAKVHYKRQPPSSTEADEGPSPPMYTQREERTEDAMELQGSSYTTMDY